MKRIEDIKAGNIIHGIAADGTIYDFEISNVDLVELPWTTDCNIQCNQVENNRKMYCRLYKHGNYDDFGVPQQWTIYYDEPYSEKHKEDMLLSFDIMNLIQYYKNMLDELLEHVNNVIKEARKNIDELDKKKKFFKNQIKALGYEI